MGVKIIVGDAQEKLRELDARSIDCIVTDPPYGETSLKWDRRSTAWAVEALRVLKPSGSMWVFGSLRMFMEGAEEFRGWKLAQDVVWEKHNGSNPFADRFRRVHELAAQFYPAERAWSEIYKRPVFTNDATARAIRRKQRPPQWGGSIGASTYRSEDGGPRLMRSVMFARSEHGRAVHPTQKPVACVLPLIEYSCPVEGTVLDPFAGSGTTGIAAQALGRHALLIEISAAYAEAARRRVDADVGLFQMSP